MELDIELRQKILQELVNIAFANPTDVMSFGLKPRLKPFNDIPKGALCAIASISQRQGETTIKMHDKIKALELLGRYVGMFDDFNSAITVLRKYGLHVFQDPDGKWFVVDDQKNNQEPNPSEKWEDAE